MLTPGKNDLRARRCGGDPRLDVPAAAALGYLVPRQFAGADRFQTAVLIASRRARATPPRSCSLAAVNFPDALSGGRRRSEGERGDPADQRHHATPALPRRTWPRLALATVFALGGPAAAAQPSACGRPIGGADRYATAVQVAQRFFLSPNPANVGLASGTKPSLTGSPVARTSASSPDAFLLTAQAALPAIVNRTSRGSTPRSPERSSTAARPRSALERRHAVPDRASAAEAPNTPGRTRSRGRRGRASGPARRLGAVRTRRSASAAGTGSRPRSRSRRPRIRWRARPRRSSSLAPMTSPTHLQARRSPSSKEAHFSSPARTASTFG